MVDIKFILVFFLFFGFSAGVVWFSEKFDDPNWEDRWIHTTQKEYKGKPFGRFIRTSGKVSYDPEDKGIRSMNDESYYAISTKIPRFTNKDKPLVIQLTVKHETKNQSNDDRLCAAAILKLFPSSLNPKKMDGDSKFHLKYGPDFCNAAGKVHAELFYKGKYYEHQGQEWSRDFGDPHIYSPYATCPQDGFTHLYTFVIFPNNTYEKRIDGQVKEHGSIEGAWKMLPPRKIKIPGERPDDWDERINILDPTETKPADWDQPEYIPDPHASQPEEWDDAIDGEWDHPMIKNPAYKGDWAPTRTIPNPNYKGMWREETHDNPDYVPDPELYLYKDIGHVGIESWQQHSGTIIDNILITDDLDAALKEGLEIQEKSFAVEEKVYNDDCDKRQKIVIAELERIQRDAKAFKKRFKKMEL